MEDNRTSFCWGERVCQASQWNCRRLKSSVKWYFLHNAKERWIRIHESSKESSCIPIWLAEVTFYFILHFLDDQTCHLCPIFKLRIVAGDLVAIRWIIDQNTRLPCIHGYTWSSKTRWCSRFSLLHFRPPTLSNHLYLSPGILSFQER